jgi:hypothetical protein
VPQNALDAVGELLSRIVSLLVLSALLPLLLWASHLLAQRVSVVDTGNPIADALLVALVPGTFVVGVIFQALGEIFGR